MKKEYNPAIDILRILAILAVIMIHTTTKTLEKSHYDLPTIPFTLLLNQSAIFAVPLFFLISGFVLELNYKKLDYFAFFKKRATRIIIPYIFWSLYYFYMYPKAQTPGASLPYLLLSGQASYQLYFIPAIIILYMIFPLLHKFMWVLSKSYVLVFLSLIQIIILWQSYYIKDFDIEPVYRILLLSSIMFPLGMVSSHYPEIIMKFMKKYIILFSALLVVTIFFVSGQSWYLYETTKHLHVFYSQYQPLTFFYTIFLAGVIFYLFSKIQRYTYLFQAFSRLSFFVFFAHISVMYAIWSWFGYNVFVLTRTNMIEKIFYDLFFFLLITIVSFTIAAIIHKIPFLSKITG